MRFFSIVALAAAVAAFSTQDSKFAVGDLADNSLVQADAEEQAQAGADADATEATEEGAVKARYSSRRGGSYRGRKSRYYSRPRTYVKRSYGGYRRGYRTVVKYKSYPRYYTRSTIHLSSPSYYSYGYTTHRVVRYLGGRKCYCY